MQVSLFKKISIYTDNAGQQRTATNFYVQLNDSLIPIEVKYFPGENNSPDPNFRGRKMIMSAFADTLPERQQKINLHPTCPNCHQPMRLEDKDTDNGETTYWWACEKCDVHIVQDPNGTIHE